MAEYSINAQVSVVLKPTSFGYTCAYRMPAHSLPAPLSLELTDSGPFP